MPMKRTYYCIRRGGDILCQTNKFSDPRLKAYTCIRATSVPEARELVRQLWEQQKDQTVVVASSDILTAPDMLPVGALV